MAWGQVEALDASAAEAAMREAAKQKAKEEAAAEAVAITRAQAEAVAIRISFAQGSNAELTNGLFQLSKEEMRPVWHRANSDRYLHRASNKRWFVSSSKHKNARDAHGTARSEPLGLESLPTDACEWEVHVGDNKWEKQQLQVRSASEEQLDFLNIV